MEWQKQLHPEILIAIPFGIAVIILLVLIWLK